MAQKISAIEQDIDDKQAKIDAEHKLSQSLVDGLEDDLASKQAKIDENNKLSEELIDGLNDDLGNKVEKTTEIGGVQIDDGIDTVQNLIYSQEEVTRTLPFVNEQVYNVRMNNIDVEFPSEITRENSDIATSGNI
jgi:hypothetical protein